MDGIRVKCNCFKVYLPVVPLPAGKHQLTGGWAEMSPAPLQLPSRKEPFVQQVATVVEINLSNPDYSVVDLSRALKISRITLYKKLLTLTGKTPLVFIRHLRLQRAAQLLVQSRLPVSEIAYATGFYNPKYFARHFKEQYNMTPSAYLKAKQKANY